MFGLSHKAKGAISVFLVLIYILVFALMCILVDGGRIRLAQAQAEEVQQLANESMLTYYHRALYEYYDLFGETKYDTTQMDAQIKNTMTQALNAQNGGALQTVMGATWITTTDGKNFFDPYDLQIDYISVGSNMNLADNDVFKSQINDSMKYSGPLILANNFFDLLDGISEATQGVEAVTDCTGAVSNVTEQISAYQERITKLRNKLYNYCNNPAHTLTDDDHYDDYNVDDTLQYAQKFDEKASDAIDSLTNQIRDRLEQAKTALSDSTSDDDGGGAPDAEPTETDSVDASDEPNEEERKATDQALDKAYENYTDNISMINDNAETLLEEVEDAITEGQQLQANIRSESSGLNEKADGKNDTAADVYASFQTQLDKSADSVDNYLETLDKCKIALEPLCDGGTLKDASDAADAVLEALKKSYDIEQDNLSGDAGVKSYHTLSERQRQELIGALPGFADVNDGDNALKEQEQKVKDAQKNTKSVEESVDTDGLSDRLGSVPSSTEENGGVDDYSKDTYNRKNASSKAKEMSSTVANLNNTFLSDMTGALRDNLFECAYVLENFRDYVHTGKMNSSNMGQTGYDTLANKKFLQGDSYLTAEQYQKIETTCAEAEYVLYGNPDTKVDVTQAYASIYAMRLAFDYVSVFLTPTYREAVMTAAEAANIAAPLVIALAPFAWALPQAAIDMQQIMSGKTMPLLYTEKTDWMNENPTRTATVAGYSDYLMFFLVMMDQTQKVDRMQDVTQMNMKKLDSGFTLDSALVNVYVDTECSVKYLFMMQAFMPAGFKLDGRHKMTLATNVSY